MAFGQTEIILILVVVIALFGAAAIPKLARSLGRAQGEFQKARREFKDEMAVAESEVDDKVVRTAKDLGIETEGKSQDQLRKEINEKLA